MAAVAPHRQVCYHPAMKTLIFMLLLTPFGMLGQTNSAGDVPTVPKIADADAEVLQLVIQDQWDRGIDMFGGKRINPPDLHGETVVSRDLRRQDTVRKLISEGKVTSGRDFWFAALIFQHSVKADDVLLAHILAVTAVARGNANGKWLSAASLDRYLWDINQPQVFGTQFKQDSQGKWSMDPYATETLSDAERAIWCVIPIQQQQIIVKQASEGKPLGSTTLSDCR
jgi:hypothetical protein